MERDEFVRLVEAVKVLPLRPSDTIILKIDEFLQDETVHRIKKHAEEVFEHKVVVLSKGMDVEILRREIA